MTFDLTSILIAFIAVSVVAAAVAVGVLVTFFAQNRTTRIRRHEGVGQYYGHLVLGH